MVLNAEPIFVLVGHGVARGAADRRDGARHQLLLLIRAANLDTAAPRGMGVALRYGFQQFTLEKADRLDISADEANEDYLKGAIQRAEEAGEAIIVYDEELPPLG